MPAPDPGPGGLPAGPVVIDLFCGAGGWLAAAQQLGLDPIGIELDPWAAATHHAAGGRTIRADVAAYPLGHLTGKVTGLIASPPCQSFSKAGKRGGLTDPRGQLVHQVTRWATALHPEWIACEQVPGVLPIWKLFAHQLRDFGYSAWAGILNSADYGVPQTRERAILMASRTRQVQPPEPTHCQGGRDPGLFGPALQPWVSMAEALGGTGAAGSWVLRPGKQANATVREPAEPAPTLAFGNDMASWQWVLRNNTQANSAKRTPGQPAPTLFFGARMNDVSWVRDQESVRVTVAEAATLQSFPPGWPWQGNKTAQFQQVGNAIPPLLARRILGTLTCPSAQEAAQEAAHA